MSKWTSIKMSDYCSRVADGTHATPKPSQVGFPLVTSKNIINGQLDLENSYLISESDYHEINKRSKVDKNDVLLSMIGSVGMVCFIKDTPTFAIKNIGLLKNNDCIHGKWLYYYLKSEEGQAAIKERLRGTTQQYIPLNEIRNLPVKVPANDKDMENIVRILSSLDDKIEANKRINRNLEEQAKAIFKSWFVDFEPFQNGDFVDPELGRIPKGWKVGKFTDVVHILGGGTPKTSMPEYWNGTIPFFTPKDVGDSIYTFATEKNLTEEGLNNCNSRLYPENTVFVTARGTVGKLALAGVPMAMNQSCYALVGKSVSPLFVFFLALQVVETLKKIANGAVFDAIVTRDFETKSVIIPPEEAINRFVELIAPLFKMIHSNVIQNTTLVQSRDTLLPKLMSGEIDF